MLGLNLILHDGQSKGRAGLGIFEGSKQVDGKNRPTTAIRWRNRRLLHVCRHLFASCFGTGSGWTEFGRGGKQWHSKLRLQR